ncbi:MAG: prolyl oligopeptidase family serine peptidase [Bacteroidota bacterium]|nr:prolyl oligopeptidase family serine peptidase [Bacteroidota bacterium]
MKHFRIQLFSACALVLLAVGAHNLQAQTKKKVLTIEDVELWRSSSVTLSDDGMWYTVLYSLNEKPDLKNDSIRQKRDSLDIDLYGEEARTNVLYICHSEAGVKYQIQDGSNPMFSTNSDWIAYRIKPESEEKDEKKNETIIELKNLSTGIDKQYKSNATYQFPDDKNYFITSDKNSLLIYDLDNKREHYIGNIGEFLIDKKSEYIAYTIASDDKRGNGIYLYNPKKMTTKAVQTGNYIYSNLSWNDAKNKLAAFKYTQVKEKVDFENMCINIISDIDSDYPESVEYKVKDIDGMPEGMGPAVKLASYSGKIIWSKDDERFFIKIKEYDSKKEKEAKDAKASEEEATVNVWHWKDKKLLSQRMLEAERNKNKVYDAIFFAQSNSIIQLTSKEMQQMSMSRGTDKWAIGTDNRAYISDWDVRKNDLYTINLLTGKKNLIAKESSSRVQISPDGESMILWENGQYWYYGFESHEKYCISCEMDISFVNKEDDHWGSERGYGFVGWVKDQKAVIVNHKLDVYLLPLDKGSEGRNLTESITSKDSIRFRFDIISFLREPEIEDRYIDLSAPIILSAFNIKTKYAGYYQLEKEEIKKLIYMPASFSASRGMGRLIKAEKSDAIIYRLGNYKNYPEAYLSNTDFSGSKKITKTNPQQKEFKWGKRILIDYTNDDGVDLQGILSIPVDYSKKQKLPMIVYSYEKMSQNMYSYASPRISGSGLCEMMYVSDGYLFLQPDIHFNVGTPHSDMHECIDAAIEKVIELGYADENCIGYEGFSYGGHSGMFMSTQDNRFAAIAAGAGVSNLVQGFNIDIVRDGSNEQDYYMTGQGRLGTDPVSDTEMFISESAVFNAQNMNTPLLLFHGTEDNVVQWEHSFGLYSILRYLKKPVVFLSYRGEGHGLRKRSNRLDIQNKLKEYFDHYLKGKEAGEWITEGLPYSLKEKSDKKKTKGKDRTVLPIWK